MTPRGGLLLNGEVRAPERGRLHSEKSPHVQRGLHGSLTDPSRPFPLASHPALASHRRPRREKGARPPPAGGAGVLTTHARRRAGALWDFGDHWARPPIRLCWPLAYHRRRGWGAHCCQGGSSREAGTWERRPQPACVLGSVLTVRGLRGRGFCVPGRHLSGGWGPGWGQRQVSGQEPPPSPESPLFETKKRGLSAYVQRARLPHPGPAFSPSGPS